MASKTKLILATRRLLNQEDPTNSHFTDPELLDYINQSIRFLGTQMEWAEQLAYAVTVQDKFTYILPDDFISLIDVYFDGYKLDILEREDLPALNGQWQSVKSSQPSVAYKSDNAVIGIFPPCDAAHAGKNLQIQYVKVPPGLSDPSDTPDLHVAFHDCIPFYATFLSESKIGNQKRSDRMLQLYDYHRKNLMSKVQRFADANLSFKWSGRYR